MENIQNASIEKVSEQATEVPKTTVPEWLNASLSEVDREKSANDEIRRRLSGTKIFLATPAYGGLLHSTYHHSVIKLINVLSSYGVQLHSFSMTNESLITRARNICAHLFLNDPAAHTHILHVDSDVGFDSDLILRMLLRDVDMIAGAYPKKKYDVKKLNEPRNYDQLTRGKPMTDETERKLRGGMLDYVLNLNVDDLVIENGLMRVKHVSSDSVLCFDPILMFNSFPGGHRNAPRQEMRL